MVQSFGNKSCKKISLIVMERMNYPIGHAFIKVIWAWDEHVQNWLEPLFDHDQGSSRCFGVSV